ncbi:MAG: DNA-3-methyladenine glycosylase 2 family protein [Chitinophagaceae bacterium]|nr:DNA-3-methyladenine glycosylase 2 family protein [Chitinophagaceae bacterium]
MSFFDETDFIQLCKKLAKKDPHLKLIIDTHGHPPLWKRRANFETLIHIILEQQVSLASANAALKKLKEKIGAVAPAKIISLTDADLKACYFSRQKIVYARQLAEAIINKQLNLKQLTNAPDDIIRTTLKKIKGIGDWTVDVYLMMVLQRTDLFPMGDIALVNSLKEVKHLPKHTTKEALQKIAEEWKPYRTVAAYLLWHSYLCKRNRKP